MSYSTTDIKANQFQNQPPGSVTPSLTDLLSSEKQPQEPPHSQFNSSKNSSGGGVNHIINNFNLDLKSELCLGGLTQSQTQSRVSNGNIGSATCSGQSMSTSVTTPTKGTTLASKKMSLNGATMSGMDIGLNPTTSTSTVQLQKKLEKKIAQASAIEGKCTHVNVISPVVMR